MFVYFENGMNDYEFPKTTHRFIISNTVGWGYIHSQPWFQKNYLRLTLKPGAFYGSRAMYRSKKKRVLLEILRR